MTEPLSRLPTLSRRTLLAGAAAAGLTAGMPPVRAAGLRWDGEAEIVIVGSDVVPDSWTKNWGPSVWDINGREQLKLES